MFDEDRQKVPEGDLHHAGSMLGDDPRVRPERYECEAPPNRDINNPDATIGGIHRAQYVQVFRNEKPAMKWLSKIIRQVDFTIAVSGF
jgi:hypothetical protein